MLAECAKVAARCAAENADHLRFLLQLCELELLERERRAPDRRLQAARFPNLKVLDEFDFAAQPLLNTALFAELLRRECLQRRESVILLGHPGAGRLHLATVLAAAACAQDKKVRFWRVTELVTALLEAREERTLLRLKGQLAKLDRLVLDEFGYVPASKTGAELLLDVISTAFERTRVVVTTNLPFQQWTEVLGSERLTGAVLDLLTRRCHLLGATGPSYRLRDAQRRRRPGPATRPDAYPASSASATEPLPGSDAAAPQTAVPVASPAATPASAAPPAPAPTPRPERVATPAPIAPKLRILPPLP